MAFTCVVVSSDGGTFAEKAEAQRPTNGHANGGEGGTCGLLSSNDSACPFALKLALISRLPKMGTIVQYAEPLGENSLGGNGEHQRFDPPLHPECTNTGTTVEPFTPYCSRGKSPEGKHLDVALVGAGGPPAHTNSVHVHPQEPPTVLQNPSTLATKHTGRGCKTTGHSRARMEMSSSSCLCIGYGEGHQLPLSWPKCTLIRSHKPPATVGQ